jgi:hypothetical protein
MSGSSASQPIPPAALLLGLAGLIPFAVAAVSPDAGLRAGISYAAVVLSFLGGIRWGTAIIPSDARRQALELTASCLPAIAGWIAILIPDILGLTLLIAGFLMQALWDVTGAEAGRLPHWFGKLRMLLTAGAVLSLVAMLLRLVI